MNPPRRCAVITAYSPLQRKKILQKVSHFARSICLDAHPLLLLGLMSERNSTNATWIVQQALRRSQVYLVSIAYALLERSFTRTECREVLLPVPQEPVQLRFQEIYRETSKLIRQRSTELKSASSHHIICLRAEYGGEEREGDESGF